MKNISVIAILMICFLVTPVYAGSHKKTRHAGHGLDTNFFHKVHKTLANQEELEISDEQYKKIKELKVDLKKNLIMQNAEIELIAVDIKSELWEDTIDKENIYKLIDQKYELKKTRAKALVEACATFNEILTDAQKKSLKGILRDKR